VEIRDALVVISAQTKIPPLREHFENTRDSGAGITEADMIDNKRDRQPAAESILIKTLLTETVYTTRVQFPRLGRVRKKANSHSDVSRRTLSSECLAGSAEA
jgi:hypothetical protein